MKKYDLAIVGAGIVGLAHAYQAARKGLQVVVFERNQFAVGASIRNFGLIWPIGQAPNMVERAMRGRADWLQLSKDARFGAKSNGSLHLAYHEDEWDILNEFISENKGYDAHLLTSEEVLAKYPHVNGNQLKGGMMSHSELTVDPRRALSQMVAYLESLPNVEVFFGQAVTSLELPKVSTFEFSIAAEELIICNGADFETLYPKLMQSSGLTKCKLQMMRTHPVDFELGPTLCAGLTLRHYAAFEGCQTLGKLNERYDAANSAYKEHGIHVLLSQNPDGELVIGDTHEYAMDFTPFEQSATDLIVLDYLKSFFKADFTINERWHGIYPKMQNGQTEIILKPDPSVTIVNGLGGAGMTLSFGLAQEVIANLFA